MIKLATLFWLVLVTATGLAMFAVKYQVQALDDRLNDTKKAVTAQDREFRVLSAEWAYLNRPAALADMNRRFLSLAPIATKQLHSGVADIAMRPPPPPPSEPPPEPIVAVAAPSNPAPGNPAPNNAIANNAGADSAGADNAGADNAVAANAERDAGAEARLPESGLRVTPAALHQPARARAGAPLPPSRPLPARSSPARSLDELIARVAAVR